MAVGALGAIGVLATVVGTGLSVVGQLQANKAAKKAERARQRQAALEAKRARREAVRRSVVARATALSNASNQGAQFSSAALGGQAQVTAAGARTGTAITQNEDIGNTIFSANRQATAGSGLAALGGGISSFGSSLTSNLGTFNRIGGSIFG